MTKVLSCLLVTLIILFPVSTELLAADQDESSESPIDVMGKIQDHDYLEVAGLHINLPRIFLVDGQFFVYASTESALASGEFIESDDHSIVKSDGTPLTIDFSITSHLMFVWFGILLSLFVTFFAAAKYKRGIGTKTEPRGIFQNIFEIFFIFIRDDVAKEYIPAGKHHKYVNYLFSVFLVIAFMNLFGLLPWGVSATADITVTGTLALFTFFITQFSGTRDHWKHVFVFPGVPSWVRIILTPVEILGLFVKPFALAIRLFANMLSGKIMIVAILGLIFVFTDLFGAGVGLGSGILWVGLTAVLYVLKAFIALLQAYIFTLLSAVFIGMAATEHDHEHEHESTVAHT